MKFVQKWPIKHKSKNVVWIYSIAEKEQQHENLECILISIRLHKWKFVVVRLSKIGGELKQTTTTTATKQKA